MDQIERVVAVFEQRDPKQPDPDDELLQLVRYRRELKAAIDLKRGELNNLYKELMACDDKIRVLAGIEQEPVFQLTPRNPETTAIQRKCKACGQLGHRARGKLPNGTPFCHITHPEGINGQPNPHSES